MSPQIIDYTKQRIRLIEQEIIRCADEKRKADLIKIKESILIFFGDKLNLNAA